MSNDAVSFYYVTGQMMYIIIWLYLEYRLKRHQTTSIDNRWSSSCPWVRPHPRLMHQ